MAKNPLSHLSCRMFTGSLMEEVKALEEDIEAVKSKVDDAMICEKVRLFVNAPREIQQIYKADAGTSFPTFVFLMFLLVLSSQGSRFEADRAGSLIHF